MSLSWWDTHYRLRIGLLRLRLTAHSRLHPRRPRCAPQMLAATPELERTLSFLCLRHQQYLTAWSAHSPDIQQRPLAAASGCSSQVAGYFPSRALKIH